MLICPKREIPASEITPQRTYVSRRALIMGAAAGLIGGLGDPHIATAASLNSSKSSFSTDEKATPVKDVTSYNNYYEFGVDKSDPARNAHTLSVKPWSIKVDGLVNNPADYLL